MFTGRIQTRIWIYDEKLLICATDTIFEWASMKFLYGLSKSVTQIKQTGWTGMILRIMAAISGFLDIAVIQLSLLLVFAVQL